MRLKIRHLLTSIGVDTAEIRPDAMCLNPLLFPSPYPLSTTRVQSNALRTESLSEALALSPLATARRARNDDYFPFKSHSNVLE